MEECPQCSGFDERINILDPREYHDLARQLVGFVAKGTFFLVSATTPLKELAQGHYQGGDLECHEFLCSFCDRHFTLSADTYHGGARWTPGPPPPEGCTRKLLQ